MYVNDLLLVDLVEIPRGSVCISRCVIRAYIVFAICRTVLQVIFLSRAFRNLKKTLESQAIENLLELWPKKKKTKRFFAITKCNLRKRCMKNWLILV